MLLTAIEPLPTTVLAVHADLIESAGPRHAEEVHFLLGMCEAKLADAYREIIKLRAELAEAKES